MGFPLVLDGGGRTMAALEHPLLKDGSGLLSPLVASLAQWHLIDDPEESLGSTLIDGLKTTLREVDALKRELAQVGQPHL